METVEGRDIKLEKTQKEESMGPSEFYCLTVATDNSYSNTCLNIDSLKDNATWKTLAEFT